MPIESKMITNSLEKAQQRVEGRHFDARKHLLDYDDVLNKHREAIYTERNKILLSQNHPKEDILEMVEQEIERVVLFHTGESNMDLPKEFAGDNTKEKGDWDPQEIVETLNTIMHPSSALVESIKKDFKEITKDRELLATQRTDLIEGYLAEVKAKLDGAEEKFDDKAKLEQMYRTIMLRAYDNLWVRHLEEMTYLRRSIGLRGYGQRDPLIEYKKEAFQMFESLQAAIQHEIVYNIFKVLDQAIAAQEIVKLAPSLIEKAQLTLSGAQKTMMKAQAAASAVVNGTVKKGTKYDNVGRNDECPCGSGKKFKKCHGA